MCSYTQVVIVTHRSPVIPCQRLTFRSSQVIFLFFLFSFIQLVDFCHYFRLCGALILESPVATRKTLVNPSSSTILIGLQLFARFGNSASQLVTGRFSQWPTLLSEGGLAHYTLTSLADQRICYGETITSYRRVYISLWFH